MWGDLVPPRTPGLALACVGSLARDELGPCSDLDLVLLYDRPGRSLTRKAPMGVGELADQLWYPLWDNKIKIDHSVRTPSDCVQVAAADLSATVGLLDLKLIAGDPDLVEQARRSVAEQWRRGITKRLGEISASVDDRRDAFGEAAHLAEPDLKESRGGLRDLVMLRALAASWLVDYPHDGLDDHANLLLDVRDALQVETGRQLDRLLLSEVDAVAARLGRPSADELRIAVSLAARHVAQALDRTLRAADQVASSAGRGVMRRRRAAIRGPQLTRPEPGLVVSGEEVSLDARAQAADPAVALRAARYAARHEFPLSPTTADNLGRSAQPIPAPWPSELRDTFVDLLASGPALLPVWEALDLAGVIGTWIPAWDGIRSRPQHNPLHRHTVDRHTIEAVVNARPLLAQVRRPDLLLMSCLLHDIGKIDIGSLSGPDAWVRTDHAAVGAPIAEKVMRDLGFAEPDVATVTRLVRHHLTLAELATRRDHDDPRTLDALFDAVDHDGETLALLRCLTEADARAAAPAAWSALRAQLIDSLADRALTRLTRTDHEPPAAVPLDLGLARSVAVDGKPRVVYEQRPGGVEIMIAAPDRLGLFADTAGLFVSQRVSVRSATLTTVDQVDPPVAVNTWRVDKISKFDLPDPTYLALQLERVTAGDLRALATVRRRERRLDTRPDPVVTELEGVSGSAVVVEVRVADRSGLLWALGTALAEIGLALRSAHVSTLAGYALDTLYLTEPDGSRPTADRAAAATQALTVAARGGQAQAA